MLDCKHHDIPGANHYSVFASHSDDGNLQCNTEKDKERLHHRTAGTVCMQYRQITRVSPWLSKTL